METICEDHHRRVDTSTPALHRADSSSSSLNQKTDGSGPSLQRAESFTQSPRMTMKGTKFSFLTVAKKVMENKKYTDREKEKQDLKSKVSELEDYKHKYDTEREEKEKLQQSYEELLSSQSDASKKLVRSNEIVDKLRAEVKTKAEKIEKYQRDISHMEDRIRNLEIRASEVEKAELILETTRQNLDQTTQQVRVRENEIRKMTKDYEDKCRQYDTASDRIKMMEEKVEDLKIQVRHELKKNDNIEKDLETIPRLHETIKEKEQELQTSRQEVEEKTALLTAARKAVREYKDKLRKIEHLVATTDSLKEELSISQCEVRTLKKLVSGKDYLVFQKSKALDLAKGVIKLLNEASDQEQAEKIKRFLERVGGGQENSPVNGTWTESEFRSESAPPPKTRNYGYQNGRQRGITVSTPPYSSENGHDTHNGQTSNKHVFLQRVMYDMPDGKKRPATSGVLRTSSLREAQKVYGHTSPSPRKHSFRADSSPDRELKSPRPGNYYKSEVKVTSKYKPSLEYAIGTQDKDRTGPDSRSQTPRLQSAWSDKSKSCHSSGSESSDSEDSDSESHVDPEHEIILSKLTPREKDRLLCEIVSVGDRVLISTLQKPPRYGKKVPKPLNYTGIVKFCGKMEREKFDCRIYIGLRLDDPLGDTDGMYKGKRYMYTPSDQGKFFKLRDVTSLLNVQTGKYEPMQKLILKLMSVKSSARLSDTKQAET